MHQRNKGSGLIISDYDPTILDSPVEATGVNIVKATVNKSQYQPIDIQSGPTINPIVSGDSERENFVIAVDSVARSNVICKTNPVLSGETSSSSSHTALIHHNKFQKLSAPIMSTPPFDKSSTTTSSPRPLLRTEKVKTCHQSGNPVMGAVQSVSNVPQRRTGREANAGGGDQLPYLFKQLIRYYEKQQRPNELSIFRRAYFAYRYA